MAARAPIKAATVLFSLATCAVVNIYYTQAIVASLMVHFSVSPEAASAAYTVASISYAIALFFCGWLARRFGAKRTMVGSAMALGLVALIPVSAYESYLLVRMLQGVFAAGIPAIGMAYVHNAYDRPEPLHAIFVAGLLFGAMSARVLGGIGAHYLGVQGLHMSLLILTGLVAVVAAFILPKDRHARQSDRLFDLLREASAPSTRFGAVTAFMFFAAFTAIYNTVGFELVATFGLNDLEIGLVFTVGIAGVAASQVMPGIGQRHGVHAVVALLYLFAIVAAIALAVKSLLTILVGLACLNFAVFGIHSTVSQQTAALAEHKEPAMSLYMICYFLGGTAGAGIAGVLYPAYGWYAVLGLSTLFVLMGLAVDAWWTRAIVSASRR